MFQLVCDVIRNIFYDKANVSFKLLIPAVIILASCRGQARFDSTNDSELNKTNDTSSCIQDWNRNFDEYPSVIVRNKVRQKVYFIGDLHGEIYKAHPLLVRSGLVGGSVENPKWIGKSSIAIFIGDVINKGPSSIETIRYLMKLESDAPTSGGEVIILAGNHEIGFLIDPSNDKAKEFRKELRDKGLDLCNDVYSSKSGIGRWLRNRPAAAMINQVFVSHSGSPRWSLEEIDFNYRELFQSNGSSTKFSCGDDKGDNKFKGFFNSRSWWAKDQKFIKGLQTLDASQIIFAHDPNAFDDRGRIVGYYNDQFNRALIKTDVGLTIGDSKGEILFCDSWSPKGVCSQFKTLKLSKDQSLLESEILNVRSKSPPDPSNEEAENEC